MSSSPAPGPSWPCGSVSPTWLTHLCPNGLGAHGLSRVPQPRMNPEWAPCAPPSWAWVGGSSLPRSGPSSLAHPVSGPSSLAHPHVSGPSSLCHPHVSGPSRLAHPHVSGPSSLCPSSRLRAQQPLPIPTSQGPAAFAHPHVSGPSTVWPASASQRLPVCTAAGYGAAGMVCPGQSTPSYDSQPCLSGRACVCVRAHMP